MCASQYLGRTNKMNKLVQVKDILQDHGLRVTQSRLAVATILLRRDSLLTADEIFSNIQKSKSLNCDQASVYRTLATFEELGLLKKSIFQGEPVRYMFDAFTEADCNHHEHYFKCNRCNSIEPFSGCMVLKKEKELEKKGYKNLHHHLEITGLCPSCAQM